MNPIEPREALWTQVNKAQLRPGDIVRFTYAAQYPSTEYVVGKVSEVNHGNYCIYFEQQPEELRAFSRTAAAPITFDPDSRSETIDLYLAPNSITARFRALYAEGLRYLAKDASGLYWAYSDRPKWSQEHGFWYGTGAMYIEPSNPVTTVVGEPVCIEEHCRFATSLEVRTRTRTRWVFSRDKWAEDLAQLSDSPRRWPQTIDGCVAWFDSDDLGTVYGPDGAEYEVHRSWCIAEEVAEDVGV